MTDEMMSFRTLLEKSPDADMVREMIGFAAQRLMELEMLTRFDEAVAVPSDLLFTVVRSQAVATNADPARNLNHAASMALTLVIRGYRQTPDM